MFTEISYLSILFYLYIIAWFIQEIYYLYIFPKFLFYKKKNINSEIIEPVSIVICAKNEAKNLEEFLPKILEQDYPTYEVIVVNDCSTDNTEDVLNSFKEKYSHLRTTFLKEQERFTHGKKLALTVGIKAAQFEWLLLTDADCVPVSDQWIKTMARNFIQKKSIVIGYGGFFTTKGFFNKILRCETVFIALLYFSAARIKIPYMGVGRNLAYRKSLFFTNKGFASHAKLLSGDDDLFVNETATSNNVEIETHPNSFTRSYPKKKISEWIDQKRRHLTTFYRYKSKHKFYLGAEIISRVIFYTLFFVLLTTNKTNYQIVLYLFMFRFINQIIVGTALMKKFKEKGLSLIFIIVDVLMPFINIYAYLLNKFRPYKQWR